MNKQWIITRTRYAPCYWPFQTYFGWDVKGYWGVAPSCVHLWQKGHFTAYLEEGPTLELGNLIIKKLLETKDLSTIRTAALTSGDQVIKELKQLAEKFIESPSTSDAIKHLEKVAELYPIIERDNMHYWLMTSFVLEPNLRFKLSHLSAEDVEGVFKDMSTVEEKSYSAKEEDSFFEIVERAKAKGLKDPAVQESIRIFTSEYFWFPYEYAGPNSWDVAAVTDRIEQSLAATHERVSDREEILRLRADCIEKFNLSPEIIKLFEIMRTMSLMQDDRKMMNSQICYYTNGVVFKTLADKLGISDRLILYSDIELLRIAECDQMMFVEELTKRAEAYAIVQMTQTPEVVTGTNLASRLNELGITIETNYAEITELKGSVGYRGMVTGRVRVLANSHITDFQEGDIIVTGMTTPDFVPLIRKAAAIITNEGGITCHAAIVARELRKPCIIGTKIATKVLKDGDLVEVDADRGIIRIIKD